MVYKIGDSRIDVSNTSCTASDDFTTSVVRVSLSRGTAVVVRGPRPGTRNHVLFECLIAYVLLLHHQNPPAAYLPLPIHLLPQALPHLSPAIPFGDCFDFIIFHWIQAYNGDGDQPIAVWEMGVEQKQHQVDGGHGAFLHPYSPSVSLSLGECQYLESAVIAHCLITSWMLLTVPTAFSHNHIAQWSPFSN